MEKKTVYVVKYTNDFYDPLDYTEYEFGAFESQSNAYESIASITNLLASKQKEYEELNRKIDVSSDLKRDLIQTFFKDDLINKEEVKSKIESIEKDIQYYIECQRNLGQGVSRFRKDCDEVWVSPMDIYTEAITNI